MKFLGIDYGTKRVGTALSDDEGRLAFPYKILQNNAGLAKTLADICAGEGVTAIVIGESRDFTGKENPIMPAVRVLKDALAKETGLPVYFESETLTTQEARRAPEQEEKTRRRQRLRQGKARKPKKRVQVDASAAALILQSYIDRGETGRR